MTGAGATDPTGAAEAVAEVAAPSSAATREARAAIPERRAAAASERVALRLDPATSSEILARAARLSDHPAAVPVTFERATLAEIADEVGLPHAAVARALAEHLVGEDEPTIVDRLLGPRTVVVHRVSGADEEEMRRRLLDLLETGHGMRSRVRSDGVVVGAKRTDVLGKLGHTMRDVQGEGRLGKLRSVQGVAVDLDDEPGVVVLRGDLSEQRRTAGVVGAGTFGVGTAGAATVGVLVTPFALLAVPIVAGAAWGVGRAMHGSSVRRAIDDLDEALDDLLVGRRPDGVIGRTAKKALRALERRRRR